MLPTPSLGPSGSTLDPILVTFGTTNPPKINSKNKHYAMFIFEPIWESPTSITLENVNRLIDAGFPYALFNSFVTAGSSTILEMILGVPAGFALAKKKMTSKFFASWIFLMLRMAPPVGFVIPLFLIYLIRLTISSFKCDEVSNSRIISKKDLRCTRTYQRSKEGS